MTSDRVLTDQTVIVEGNRIIVVGPRKSTPVPKGATVIDGSGKYLIPGLAEMHAHVPGGQASDADINRVMYLFAAHGITTIRGMLGAPRHLELRGRLERGEVVGPQLITTGPSLNGNSVGDWATAKRLVEEQQQAGYDLLKIHPGIQREPFDTLAATARRVKIRFAGHVPLDVGLDRALAAPYWSIDHLDGYVEAMAVPAGGSALPASQFFGANLATSLDTTRIPALAARTRAAGVWNVPTQVLFENLASEEPGEAMAARPEMQYMPAAVSAQWVEAKKNLGNQLGQANLARLVVVRRQLIKALQDAGAGLLLGSDAPQIWNVPGISTHRELESLVAAGLTPYQALTTGTVNVGRYLGREGEMGTIEAGRRADLVLLEANPLDDIRNSRKVSGVVLNGHWMDRATLDAGLAALK
jgi:imidazolonepropionase-like amidohydrolase